MIKGLVAWVLLVLTIPISGSVLSSSPFADRPCKSYSSSTDLRWGDAPVNDFGPFKLKLNLSGIRQLNQVPAPGIHPRILITPADLPELRDRLRNTRCGQMMWNKVLSYSNGLRGTYDDNADYAKPDLWKGRFGGSHGHVRLLYYHDAGSPFNPKNRGYARLIEGDLTVNPGPYWSVMSIEAFRCLIERDKVAGANLGKAVLTAMRHDQALREQQREAKHQRGPIDHPVSGGAGGQELGWIYDLDYNFLGPEARTAIHDELANTTWYHDNYGTFNDPERTYSNWATFGYWWVPLLAIEGEPGFNDIKLAGLYRGYRDYFSYGVLPSGAVFEGEAKDQMGMDGIIAFARRGLPNLAGHPHVRAYTMNFLPHSIMPNPDFKERSSSFPPGGFVKYDRLGGTGNILAVDSFGLKYLFPKDPIADWVFHVSVGDDYLQTPDGDNPGYWNQLLIAAMMPSDYDPANSDPSKLGLGLSFIAGDRALVMTRSGWDRDALMLNLHVRGVNGGHPYADRNSIFFAGKGRVWVGLNQWIPDSNQQSQVQIDDWTQDAITPGRLVDVVDQPQATFAVGDASYCWNWHLIRVDSNPVTHRPYTLREIGDGRDPFKPGEPWELHSYNDFTYTPVPLPSAEKPLYQLQSWIGLPGTLTPMYKKPNHRVIKAFRTTGIVRGAHPYALVLDDIQADQSPHDYSFQLLMEKDLTQQQETIEGFTLDDEVLQGAAGPVNSPVPPTPAELAVEQPKLLIRALRCDLADPAAKITSTYEKIKDNYVLSLKATSVDPKFIVLMYPYRKADPLPVTSWDAGHTVVSISFPDYTDHIATARSASGKTDITISRTQAGHTSILASINKPLKPFEDTPGAREAN
jgi:hypothetical protein